MKTQNMFAQSILPAVLALAQLLLLSVDAKAARFDFDSTPGRLTKDVVPSNYKLHLELDPATEVFSGRVEIDLTVRRAASEIVLQATALHAINATLLNEAEPARKITVTAERESSLWRLTWDTPDLLPPGKWRLQIDYEGTVEQRGQALYRVGYRIGTATELHYMLATQLQPTNARAVFPSFDEPSFRATFDIAITAPSKYEVVSNMPVEAQRSLSDGRRRTEFFRTPSMPSYLVALAVGEFEAISDEYDGISLRVLTVPGRSHEAQYAMDATKQLLGYFKEYFGMAYMLPKLDQLAIPGVRFGAMEDWGAISYNENLLLFDPQRSPPKAQQAIFGLIAHEIAHQWFGNLVTPAWWDDIWLNEAFATWIGDKALHHFNPTWRVDLSRRHLREPALRLDARSATRAVVDPPAHESTIVSVFDPITYRKGGAVLSMFEAKLGETTFREGLRSYINKHQYSNATADDLLFHLSDVAGRDVAPMISDWLQQRGFPLLDVSTVCLGSRMDVRLSQRRFSAQRGQTLTGTWRIPVVINAGKQSKRLVLGSSTQKHEFAGCLPIMANADDIGYYRVRYDAGNMARLFASFSQLAPTERIGLVADSMALARAGLIEFSKHFSLLEALRDERAPAVWEQVIEGLLYLDRVFIETPAQLALRAYGRSLLQPQLKRLGWRPNPSDDAATLRVRNALIDALGQFDDPEVIGHAVALFTKAQAMPSTPVDPSIRAGVIRTATRAASHSTFSALRKLLRESTSQEDRSLYGGAMVVARDPRLVYQVLELALTDEWPPETAIWYVRHVGIESGHVRIARDFIVRNFDGLSKKASARGRLWLLPDAYSGFNVAHEADDLLAVQERLLGENAMVAARQNAEAIREKAAIVEREEKRLVAVLKSVRKLKANSQKAATGPFSAPEGRLLN